MSVYEGKDASIVVDNTTVELKLSKELNCGTYKCAIEVFDDLVLILPSRLPASKIWDKTVDDEIGMSELLTSIGLLNPNHKRVVVKIEDMNFNAYLSKNFRAFQNVGIFVIEGKFFQRSDEDKYRELYTKLHLFRDEEIDINNMKSWEPILTPLLHDVMMLHKHKVKLVEDTINYALVRRDDISLVSEYTIRYFGFDFSPIKKSEIIDYDGHCWNPDDYNNIYDMLGVYDKIFGRAVSILLSIVYINRYGLKPMKYGFVFSDTLPDEFVIPSSDILEHFRILAKSLHHGMGDSNCPIEEEDY